MKNIFIFLFLAISIKTNCQDCGFIAIESKEVLADSPFCVGVNLASEVEMYSFQFKVSWDPTQLEFQGIDEENINNLEYTESTAGSGFMNFVYFSISTPLPKLIDSQLFDMCFVSLVDIGSDIAITLTEIEFTDSDNMIMDNCILDAWIMVMDDPSQDVNIQLLESVIEPSCSTLEVGEIVVMPFFGTKPYTYEWSGVYFTEILNGRGIGGIFQGGYSVTVTDSNGDTASKNFAIRNGDLSGLSSVVMDAACETDDDGYIELDVPQYHPPYSYDWNNGENTLRIDGLSSGLYEVTITDVNSCSITQSFAINRSFSGDTPVLDIRQPSCAGSADGSITVVLGQGNNLPLEYFWNTGESGQSISALEAGMYYLTIEDALGCNYLLEAELEDQTSIEEVIITNTQLTCASFNEANGGARISIDPREDDFLIAWEDGVMHRYYETRRDLAIGVHRYEVISGGGCVLASDSVLIQEGLRVFQDTYYTCGLDTLSIIFEQGNDDLEYFWSPTNFFSDPSDSASYYLVDIFPDSIPVSYSANLRTTGTGGCSSIYPIEIFVQDDCVWPGDTDSNRRVDVYDLLNIGLVNGEVGRPRSWISIDWYGHPSEKWTRSIPGSNLDMMHSDCNGDGEVNENDTLAITGNAGLSHRELKGEYETTRNLVFSLNLDIDGEVFSGQNYQFDLLLGDMASLTEEVYGLAFRLYYDSGSVIEEKVKLYLDGWLGNESDAWMIQRLHSSEGVLEVAIVRNDKQNISGQGRIATLSMSFESRAIDNEVNFEFQDVKLINSDGEIIASEGNSTSTILKGTTSTSESKLLSDMIFPNPIFSRISIVSDRSVNNYEVYDLQGKLVQNGNIESNIVEVSSLRNGLYFLLLNGHDGASRHRFVKVD